MNTAPQTLKQQGLRGGSFLNTYIGAQGLKTNLATPADQLCSI